MKKIKFTIAVIFTLSITTLIFACSSDDLVENPCSGYTLPEFVEIF